MPSLRHRTAAPMANTARVRSLAWTLWLWCAIAGVARAEDIASGPLTRAQAVQLGLTRNVAAISSRLQAMQADEVWRAAWINYVPKVTFDADLRHDTPPIFPFTNSNTLGYQAGVTWRAPVGTSVELLGLTTHGLGGPNGIGADGALRLAVSQPLLRGAWYTGASQPLREADALRRIQQEVLKDALNQLVVEIDGAYWDLAVTQSELQIKIVSRDRAKAQYDDTAENIRRGLLAPGEIYVVEENVVFFEQALIRQEQALGDARRTLAALLQLTDAESLRATDSLEGVAPGLVNRAVARQQADRANPSLAAQRLRAELAQTRLNYAMSQSLPAVDLTGAVALGGTALVLEGLWGSVVSDPGPDARIGVSFAMPLDRPGVSAEVAAVKLEAMRQQLGVTGEQTRVGYAVDTTLKDLEATAKQLALTRQLVELAELKLQTQNEKYKSGLSTLQDVVRFQRDVDDTAINLQRVLLRVRVGNARLLATQGTLYQTVGATLR